jgi:hypothetical protein
MIIALSLVTLHSRNGAEPNVDSVLIAVFIAARASDRT